MSARAISSEPKRGDLLTGLLANFGVTWWIAGDGLIHLRAEGEAGTSTPAASPATWDARLMAAAEEAEDTDNTATS